MRRTEGRRPYLHVVVSDALRDRITNRECPPGSILPSEHDLTEEFGVSRSVVRQALRTLADEGHVQVVPGRGTVVSAHREFHRDAQRTAGLSAQMRSLGARVGTRVLRYDVAPDREHGPVLGTDRTLALERLRLLDGEPVAYIRTWLPEWVADRVGQEELEDSSLHAQLRAGAGVEVRGGPRQIRAVAATGTMAERLAVPPGSPVLLLEGQSLDQAGRVIEVFATWHRSDRIALDITNVEAPTGPAPSDAAATADPGSAGDPATWEQVEQAAAETLRLVRQISR